MARAPKVGERVPSVCRAQVIPQISPHGVGVCVSEWLVGQRAAYQSMWRPLGTALQASPCLLITQDTNIYLGKAEVN